MDWRGETMTPLSDKIFSNDGPNYNRVDSDASEVLSNLPLQMALYFNVIFAPVWILVLVIFLADTFYCYDELYKFVTITVIVAISIVEILRLYLGYEGNLKDKIPELAGFWMLSLFLQFPLQSFLLLNPLFRLPITEVVVQSVMVLLLIAQIIFGYFALKYTSAQQALYFKIMKFNRDVSWSDIKEKYKVY